MAKQDFEQFKQDVKEWLNSHPEEYDRFVAEVNNKSATGLQKVFKLGWKLTPQMMRKYQNEVMETLLTNTVCKVIRQCRCCKIIGWGVSQFAKRFNSSCNVGMALLRQVL